ncbi:hypothetical protein ACFVH7_11845 [Kitasatospora indigofera]|uniref:hypothetical protein n=1 Tax=Kitasatospora indigofera TaxID=67307 RepID=UPI003632F4C0
MRDSSKTDAATPEAGLADVTAALRGISEDHRAARATAEMSTATAASAFGGFTLAEALKSAAARFQDLSDAVGQSLDEAAATLKPTVADQSAGGSM